MEKICILLENGRKKGRGQGIPIFYFRCVFFFNCFFIHAPFLSSPPLPHISAFSRGKTVERQAVEHCRRAFVVYGGMIHKSDRTCVGWLCAIGGCVCSLYVCDLLLSYYSCVFYLFFSTRRLVSAYSTAVFRIPFIFFLYFLISTFVFLFVARFAHQM